MNKTEKKIYDAIINEGAICIDSRNVSKNSVFFALKGENFDGNNFAIDSIKNGCKLAVIDNPKIKVNKNTILVHDVLKTLQNIALKHREKFNIPFIGITGTNGKTTTKELLSSVLSKKYKSFATEGNLNNHIGVPVTLLNIKNDAEIAVIELGANHTGEIEALSNLAKPTHGLITNIGKAHLEGFGSIENITKAKSELYNHIKNNKGILFVNYDNNKLMQLSENSPRVTYGKSQNADYIGEIIENKQFLQIEYYEKKQKNKKHKIKTNLVGNYNFDNVIAAVCIGSFFGVDKTDIKEAIESYFPSNNRSQFIKTDKNTILMDAYNANPTSMKLALENFTALNLENKIAILGDMLELGEVAREEHDEILDFAVKQGYNKIILVGEEFCKSAVNRKNTLCFKNNKEIIKWLKENPIAKSSILIKASRGIELEKILDYL